MSFFPMQIGYFITHNFSIVHPAELIAYQCARTHILTVSSQ